MGTMTKDIKVKREVYTCDRCKATTDIMYTTIQAMCPMSADTSEKPFDCDSDEYTGRERKKRWEGVLCDRCATMNHHRIQTPIVHKKRTKKGEDAKGEADAG